MDKRELAAWLRLSLMPGMSSRFFCRLLQYFRSPSQVFTCHPHSFACQEISPALRSELEKIHSLKSDKAINRQVEDALRWAEQEQQHILLLSSKDYPLLLKEIPDPPPVLYVRGRLEALALPQVALVGSRKASPGGLSAARRLAGELAAGGFTVCSGLARGIDAASHEGALAAGGWSTAVLACGLNRIYPRGNTKLADRIAANGALASEFPLQAEALPWHFPQRNRIISGLSQGVLVIEAALRSGSLITARYALEQGREVFAVPGSVHNQQARGCHHLLKAGAKLVESAADVAAELGAFFSEGFGRRQAQNAAAGETLPDTRAAGGLGPAARALLTKIDYDVVTVDQLVTTTGYEAALVNVLLVELELQGLVQARTGGYTLAV